jgi:DNA polymerase III subunit beta
MNRSLLLTAVQFAAQAITGKTSLPVLECLHLKGDGKTIQITGYNLDLYARMEVESDLVLDCCAPAGKLKAILSALPDEDISINQHQETIAINGKGTAMAKILPGADFPPIPEVTGKRFSLPGAAIDRVIDAVSTDETRHALCAVFLDKDGVAVASDGRRVHTMAIDEMDASVILPELAADILSGETGEMRVNGKFFVATGDGWEVGGKVIEGTYFRWRQTIPKETPGIPVAEGLIDAITRAMACGGTEKTVEIRGTSVRGSGENPYHEDIQTGLKTALKVNPVYFLAALKSAGEGATIAAPDDTSPIVIKNGGFTAVVMPMRISQ